MITQIVVWNGLTQETILAKENVHIWYEYSDDDFPEGYFVGYGNVDYADFYPISKVLKVSFSMDNECDCDCDACDKHQEPPKEN